jgi:hypothetical protein
MPDVAPVITIERVGEVVIDGIWDTLTYQDTKCCQRSINRFLELYTSHTYSKYKGGNVVPLSIIS